MRKRYYLLVIPVLLIALLPRHSVYNATTGALYCDSSAGCLHEIAHRMDDDIGHPSRTPEFGNAVMIHLAFAYQYGLDETARLILTQEGLLRYSERFSLTGSHCLSSPQEELYATLYEKSGGDVAKIAPAFREFYSDDEIYTDLYNCLMSADFKICGLALHKEGK